MPFGIYWVYIWGIYGVSLVLLRCISGCVYVCVLFWFPLLFSSIGVFLVSSLVPPSVSFRSSSSLSSTFPYVFPSMPFYGLSSGLSSGACIEQIA